MKLKRKAIANFVIVLLLVLSLAFVVVACNDNNPPDNGGNNPPAGSTGDENAPVYTGMTMSNTIAPHQAYALASTIAYGENNGGIQTLADEEYRAGKNEDVYITIHFDNPKNFEILSFTINEEKFSSYMFQSGSDMENIIIKENIGDADLNVEYTIDAIKYVDGEAIKDVKIGGNKTIKVMVEYNITYYLDGGENGDNPSKYIMSDEIKFEDATRIGYTFKGWFKDEKFTKPLSKIERYSTGDVELYAQWEIITYTITYHLDGGINNEQNPTSYTVETRTNLAKATKDDYTFMGWYADADFTEQISWLDYGNLDLYAKWAYGTEGLSFRLEDDSYTVTGYNGTSDNVIIPEEWYGLPVKTIGDKAFYNCSSFASIEIPNSVIEIGIVAFYNCSSLTSITFGANSQLTTIGYEAFWGCSSLTSIELPSSVTTIGDGAFYDCSSLASIEIPSGVTTIGREAFYNCSSLESITIPDSITSIAGGAFNGCSSLVNMTLPFVGGSLDATSSSSSTLFGYIFGTSSYTDGVRVVQTYGSNPYNYIDYYIPSSLKSVTITGGNILNGAFSACRSLESIIIPDSVTSIGDVAFGGCSSLESIIISDSVTNIGEYAFGGCSSLTSIIVNERNQVYRSENNCLIEKETNTLIAGCKNSIIPYGVTAIGHHAFSRIPLMSIEIPNSVTTIESYAFEHSDLTSITIPDSVTSIGDGTFYYCDALREITIPNTVKSIGDNTFYECSSLKTVYYGGNEEQWNKISIGSDNNYLTDATRYYYSANYPFSDTVTSGNYWHYNDNGEPTIWEKETE